MIKPERLQKGDKVALVSLSSGCFGEPKYRERLEATLRNLREIFGLKPVIMPHALIGKAAVYQHPELRAKDLMDAFLDDEIRAVFTFTGGDDTIRLLPYIDFDVLRTHPKIFMGFSDTTANHFMLYKAGVTSYYGPAAGVEFSLDAVSAENIATVKNTLFAVQDRLELPHYGIFADDPQDWNRRIPEIGEDRAGYDVVQGSGVVRGKLLGGCMELFMMMNGTAIWPSPEEWEDKVLFLETSEDQPAPEYMKYTLYNLGAQGILGRLRGILVGRPKNGKFYGEYNAVIREAARVFGRADLPIVANCHFGHAWLWHILPFGCQIEIDCNARRLTLTEAAVK